MYQKEHRFCCQKSWFESASLFPALVSRMCQLSVEGEKSTSAGSSLSVTKSGRIVSLLREKHTTGTKRMKEESAAWIPPSQGVRDNPTSTTELTEEDPFPPNGGNV